MDNWNQARQQLIEGVWQKLGLRNDGLKKIMLAIPRHRFVDSALGRQAYTDTSLPIDGQQTISQPSMVATMTNALAPQKNDKILEIGTGSGYQTAVLAHYTPRIYTVERVAPLSQKARLIHEEMGLRNIIYKIGDGSNGWESWAPFDRIIVTAGAPVVTEALKKQLAEGGRLLIPCGDRETQKLLQIDRLGDLFIETDLGPCRFVPLIGQGGWEK